jgi:hypothetical protein
VKALQLRHVCSSLFSSSYTYVRTYDASGQPSSVGDHVIALRTLQHEPRSECSVPARSGAAVTRSKTDEQNVTKKQNEFQFQPITQMSAIAC